jgi:hypothetical protein
MKSLLTLGLFLLQQATDIAHMFAAVRQGILHNPIQQILRRGAEAVQRA